MFFVVESCFFLVVFLDFICKTNYYDTGGARNFFIFFWVSLLGFAGFLEFLRGVDVSLFLVICGVIVR